MRRLFSWRTWVCSVEAHQSRHQLWWLDVNASLYRKSLSSFLSKKGRCQTLGRGRYPAGEGIGPGCNKVFNIGPCLRRSQETRRASSSRRSCPLRSSYFFLTFLLPPAFKWRSISEKMSQMVHYRSSKEDFGERPRQNRSRRIQQEEEKSWAESELNSSPETTGLDFWGVGGARSFFLNSVRFPSDSSLFFFSLRQK